MPEFQAANRNNDPATLDRGEADDLRFQARRCRRLAASAGDQRTIDTLNQMAAEYEAALLEAGRTSRQTG